MEQDVKTYEYLFKKYWKAVFHYCNKILKDDSEAAKDVAEEAFIKMWLHMPKFESEENVKAFVYIVAKNNCFNLLQQIQRRGKDHKEISRTTEYFEEIDFDIINAEVISYVYNSLHLLPPQCGETIRLFLKGHTSNEIAAKMKITRKTCLNQKLKGISILNKLVKLKFDI